ncbi:MULTISPECIES: hypothetical protein [Halomonadaceae]|uniref:hypothetical protein n=1 Tax=Halomonadaceae TaxID=28256 RepID=UPI001582AA63|nr:MULTISPECIES: hypothetical protein [Halomonas]MDI4637442.1 hypothetical protein [Halomonas sp. BMC7]NUJ61276.1 hypothetical protein [Halomonas taeanensis]
MNRIVIVGHPSSGYQDVEALLQQYGMADAAPSRREGMSVHAIQDSLCQAYSASPVDQAQHESELAQVELSPVWQELALDLLLGNMEQAGVWGWAASNTLPLLKLWHEADEKTWFILTYQHPAMALQQAMASDGPDDPELILNNWVAYHRALLSFYRRHPERCLLVHTQQLINQPEQIVGQFSQLTYADRQTADFSSGDTSPLEQLLDQLAIGDSNQREKIVAAPLAEYLHQQVVEQHDALAVYEKLQDSATQPAASNDNLSALSAWQHLQVQHKALPDFLKACQQRLKGLQMELERQKVECDTLKAASTDLKSENDELKKAHLEPPSVALQQENAMLLEQLHIVQEELERLHQRGVSAKPASVQNGGPYYGADERIKRQLTYRLGAVVVRSSSLKDFIMLPFALKREHKAFQRDKQARQGEALPPIERYADAHKAEQVKRHLSYRLGRVIMASGGSPFGWAKLPFALSRQAKAFRCERAR